VTDAETGGRAPAAGAESASIASILRTRRVVVCCGTGGVGKTTTAAALAIQGARDGRRAVVVTIDPAKRLAQTLGLEQLSNTAHEIDRTRWDVDGSAVAGGRLHALMLDAESTFDDLVRQYAHDEEQASRILGNGFYRNIAGSLSGTQEYMAMEKLYELHATGSFDLIVVDTPPTRHALDFLDAPRRLTRLLDNRIFRLLMTPARAGFRVGTVAAQAFLRTIARVVGTEVIDDVLAFFRAFEGMEEGFRTRANEMLALLGSDESAFVLVTSPRHDAVVEATYFADRLAEGSLAVEALVVNRVHPRYPGARPDVLRARADQLLVVAGEDVGDVDRGAALALAAQYENLADLEELAIREERELHGLEQRIGTVAVAHVPELAHDVHDFDALRAVAHHLV
jgi:anion-transporting  ArsA/GET3 family ATPase